MRFVGVVAIVLATCAPAHAQSGVNGTWQAGSWSVALRASGSTLTGVAQRCGAVGAIEILEGRIEGNIVSFKCKSPNGDNTLTFTGNVNGDQIAFNWTHEVRDGNPLFSCCIDHDVFGASSPQTFIANRVPAGELGALADDVKGSYFSAAVNLPQKDVKVVTTLFLPVSVTRVRAIIVVSAIGLGDLLFDDPTVRRFLETVDIGILSNRVDHVSGKLANTASGNAAEGGGEGLLIALQELAQATGHQEIATAPLLFWGHSGGGPFGPTFAAQHPERTLGFIGYHSGGAGRGGIRGADIKVLSQTPALLFGGGADLPGTVIMRDALWKSGRVLGAPWTFALEPDASHGASRFMLAANDLLLPWIAAILRLRLARDGQTLRVSDGTGWLGNIQSGDIAPSTAFTGTRSEATWLPDEPTARAWQQLTGQRR